MASAIFPTQNVRIPQQQVDNAELDTESCRIISRVIQLRERKLRLCIKRWIKLF